MRLHHMVHRRMLIFFLESIDGKRMILGAKPRAPHRTAMHDPCVDNPHSHEMVLPCLRHFSQVDMKHRSQVNGYMRNTLMVNRVG